MRNSLHMFTALNTGLKIPFDLSKFSSAQPVGQTDTAGTILYGVGIPQAGIQVKEALSSVSETVNAWYQNNAAGTAGRV